MIKVTKTKKKEKLTAKQEKFAYLVGYENKPYITAYKNTYDTNKMKDATLYPASSRLANKYKISIRIDEWRLTRVKEERRKFSWSITEAEAELRAVLNKNKNDLIRAEKENRSVKHATNSAILQAIDSLNAIGKRIEDEENDLELRKAKAETELAENKNRILKEKMRDENDTTIYEIIL